MQSQVRYNRVLEKVPEKVPEKVCEVFVQNQVRFDRVAKKPFPEPCRTWLCTKASHTLSETFSGICSTWPGPDQGS